MTPRSRRWLVGLLALACIAVQLPGSLLLSLLALVLWLAALALVDRPGLRRMWLPRFWLITALVALASGLLLGSRDPSLPGFALSRSGLEAGALMMVRGAFIFGLAIWASRAVDESDIQRFFRRFGLGALGAAIPSALNLLPQLQQQFHEAARSRPRTRGARRLYHMAVELFCETALLAERLAGPRLAAVVGQRGVGKTRAILRLVDGLRERGLALGGVAQPATHEQGARGGEPLSECGPSARDRHCVRVGYRLRDVATGEEVDFARARPSTPGLDSGGGLGFSFEPQGWSRARELIVAARHSADAVVVDELGRLEAEGGGHLPALLEPLERQRAQLYVVAVRADRLEAIMRRLGRCHLLQLRLPASDAELDDFVAFLARRVVTTTSSPDGMEEP